MSGKEQFIKLPREVLESEAFGSLGINGFRGLASEKWRVPR
jgi:hypothetical protein